MKYYAIQNINAVLSNYCDTAIFFYVTDIDQIGHTNIRQISYEICKKPTTLHHVIQTYIEKYNDEIMKSIIDCDYCAFSISGVMCQYITILLNENDALLLKIIFPNIEIYEIYVINKKIYNIIDKDTII